MSSDCVRFLSINCRILAILCWVGAVDAAAQSFADCSGQQTGAIPGLGKVSAYYSDCSSTAEASTDEYHWALIINSDSGNIEISRQLSENFVPSPTASVSIGVQAPLKFGLRDMGSDYNGSCAEVTAVATSSPQMDGNTYCGWVESVVGRKILLIGTLTKGSFVDGAIRTTDTDGDGNPDGSDPTPNGPLEVPTIPPWVILLLAAVSALWLARRLPRARSVE